ncbi:MAG TPA: hypothetical protein K8V84_15310 [Nocardiopsis listeri]|uniref:hypothetical protein n=1 Tax=Nocardiopsis listeri TaxID=53440 RepID=UPI001DCB6E1E|nr:hypothetical protein [Nocardiopsis listeri]HJE59855.1 hypothetical protein [Nocardiopsis listeri]
MRRHRDQDVIFPARRPGLLRVPRLNVGRLSGNLLWLLGVLLPMAGGLHGGGWGQTRLPLLSRSGAGRLLRVLRGLWLLMLRRILLSMTGLSPRGPPGRLSLCPRRLRMRPGRLSVPRPAALPLRRLWRQRRLLLPLRLVRGRGVRRGLAHALPWIRCRGC